MAKLNVPKQISTKANRFITDSLRAVIYFGESVRYDDFVRWIVASFFGSALVELFDGKVVKAAANGIDIHERKRMIVSPVGEQNKDAVFDRIDPK